MRKIYSPIIAIALLAFTTMTAWAVIPPPPVNQNLGMPDTMFNEMFSQDAATTDYGYKTCKRCHKPQDIDPVNYPDLQKPTGIPKLKGTYLPTRHHLHVDMGQPGVLRNGLIAGGPEQPPQMDVDGDGVDDEKYTCYSCHQIMPVNPWTGGVTENHRNCFNCHKVFDGPNNTGAEKGQGWRTVHHDTPKAYNAQCDLCHGYLMRSLDTGRPAPNWLPSIITPWKSGKLDQDTSKTSSAGTHPGNCTFCHNSADGSPGGTDDATSNFSYGFSSIKIYQNNQNHHATGIPTLTDVESPVLAASGETPCMWCHFMNWTQSNQTAVRTYPDGVTQETIASWNIRGCQRCHDIPSLHAIEADVAGDGIIPGQEEHYNGHVGNQDNCWGCHGFDPTNAPDAVTGLAVPNIGPYAVQATVPQLDEINALVWQEGSAVEGFILAGTGFENDGVRWDEAAGSYVDQFYEPSVQLTDAAGNVTQLAAVSSTPTRISVTIPATLPAGNYDVQVSKGVDGTYSRQELSNPKTVTILPAVNVAQGAAICLSQYRVVIVRGSGFTTVDGTTTYGEEDPLTGEITQVAMPSIVTGIIGDGVDASRLFLWRDGMIAARFNAGCPSEVVVNTLFDSKTLPLTVW